jgi:hypothetical protein
MVARVLVLLSEMLLPLLKLSKWTGVSVRLVLGMIVR